MNTKPYPVVSPLFSGSRIIGNCIYPRYPKPLINGGCDSLVGAFWFETLPQPGLSGGSRYRAYFRARSMASRSRAYNGQYYSVFAGPKGFLP